MATKAKKQRNGTSAVALTRRPPGDFLVPRPEAMARCGIKHPRTWKKLEEEYGIEPVPLSTSSYGVHRWSNWESDIQRLLELRKQHAATKVRVGAIRTAEEVAP